LADVVVDDEGLRHQGWVRQACGFDDHAVKLQRAVSLLGVQFTQDTVEQRGLAAAQKAGEDGDGNGLVLRGGCCCCGIRLSADF
jgi:hypothetical protein